MSSSAFCVKYSAPSRALLICSMRSLEQLSESNWKESSRNDAEAAVASGHNSQVLARIVDGSGPARQYASGKREPMGSSEGDCRGI